MITKKVDGLDPTAQSRYIMLQNIMFDVEWNICIRKKLGKSLHTGKWIFQSPWAQAPKRPNTHINTTKWYEMNKK